MTKTLGVIAEDVSDVEVLKVISQKVASKPFSVRYFVGQGCGRIKNKCSSWARTLKARGCNLLVVVHDLDDRNASQLRQSLHGALGASPIPEHVIVIPIRELEAWLLADHRAIEKTFRFKKPLAQIANPESIMRPKERLRDIIYQKSNRRIIYVNTIHNPQIANNCSISNFKRCASFQPLEQFLIRVLGAKSKGRGRRRKRSAKRN